MTTVKKQNLKSFIKDYKVAAFASSSRFLVNEVLKQVGYNLDIVVEQGPGDGVLTRKLLKHIKPTGKLILIEQNKEFIKILKNIKDDRVVIFEGFAQQFDSKKFLQDYGLSGCKVDMIISSIPFSFLKVSDREKIVKKSYEDLRVGGKFIIFHQYSLIMNSVVKKFFHRSKTRFVLLNLFPCFIISSQKAK